MGITARQKISDAVLALMALDRKRPEAQATVREAYALPGERAAVEGLVRACFKKKACTAKHLR